MKVAFWGVRGSIPVADPGALRYGGNTSCVTVRLGDGSLVVLDAGTGIRALGTTLKTTGPIHILLTHLHLDHIMGLLFFAPLFQPEREVSIWGPRSSVAGLRDRLARYLSTPLSPVEIRELPATVSFQACPPESWRIGPAEVLCTRVAHRGPTLGYRISEGSESLAYLPDHEPGLGQRLDSDPPEWISGLALARDASLLIHDAQYTELEYETTIGWGHSRVADALAFARRSGARRVRLFHHDPAHDDAMLDRLAAEAREAWAGMDGQGELALACETEELDIR
jgi:phosphoribosyl 1,2-cyclic phosphodiesterase